MNKKGNLLTENVIFIVLNLIFLSILIGFIFLQGAGKVVIEQNYAKQIALLIDSSEPGTDIILNVRSLVDEKDKNFPWRELIKVSGNTVFVKLSEDSRARYDFFSDVEVTVNPNTPEPKNSKDVVEYKIIIRNKQVLEGDIDDGENE